MNLLKLLPQFYRKDDIIRQVLSSSENIFLKIEQEIKEFQKQIFLSKATYGLDIFEKELQIVSKKSKPIQERRNVIAAKWRGAGTLTLELIQQTLNAYSNCNADVRFTGVIEIDFNVKASIPINYQDILSTVNEIKPAHLGINCKTKIDTEEPAIIYSGCYCNVEIYISIEPYTEQEYNLEIDKLMTGIYVNYELTMDIDTLN